MRKLYLLLFLSLIFTFSNISAQLKIGYVDSDAIMKKLPYAQDAQKKIDAQIDEWERELDKLDKKWKDKFDDYERRKLIMSKQKRAEFEKELISLEQETESFKQAKFGANGELFAKQEELMKPIQNQVFTAIEEIAVENELDFIFDRSGDMIFLYAKEEYDFTPQVLSKLQ
jgi:outer membrane protein